MNPHFFEGVAVVIEQARCHVGRTADLTMCVTYFEIGRKIVEQEQDGKKRAEYGRGLLEELSMFLNKRFGKGFSVRSLKNFRQFYLAYEQKIRQTMFAELEKPETLSPKSENDPHSNNNTEFDSPQKTKKKPAKSKKDQVSINESEFQPIRQSLIAEFSSPPKKQPSISGFVPFRLSWSHYLVLMRIKNEQERSFYEIEVVNQQWTVRQLQRQHGSSLYERLALSRDKTEVMRLANEGQVVEKPRDLLKNPLVLEFLGLEENSAYSESDLESAMISKLQTFLLELGKGFLFESRQRRFTFDEEHFIVDLVFYNRLLQCYVLIDLKTDKLKHQDLGQMQMYVNYFDRYVKAGHEKPTVGILLCKEKNDSVVELTLPEDANIYASEYRVCICPTKPCCSVN